LLLKYKRRLAECRARGLYIHQMTELVKRVMASIGKLSQCSVARNSCTGDSSWYDHHATLKGHQARSEILRWVVSGGSRLSK